LLKAYQALQDGQSPQALEQVSKLVSDHPEFSLAQLLYADLLAARIGQPRAFGVSPQSTPHPADRRLALLEEARRRWSAVHEGPPAGHLPMEFVRIAPDVRHAVAIDASRSRLYLFENGPNGLSLKKDIYVSVGKQGVGKRMEGDQRTPLGVYWITNTFKGPMHDPRLGQAALGINYPNVWDRHLGRTGSGLFLHGVPSELLAHVPQATDGCVAMSNDEATALLATVDPGTTPVLIAWSLEWVPAERVGGHHRGFLEAYGSWEQARQRGDQVAASVWYDGRTPIFATPTAGAASPPTILAWLGDGVPVMVVSTTHPYIDDGQPGMWRQYWTQLDGQWRIFFDNMVEIRGNRQALEGSRSSSQSRKSRERSG
jgi:L,D-peptidoglycan transpeptidase YkuD (ErfK/YbiS/YcfS/YnhG family)